MFLFNFIFVEVYFVAKQYFPPYCQYELFNWFVRTQLLKNFGCMNFVLEVIFSCFSYVEAGGSCFHLFIMLVVHVQIGILVDNSCFDSVFSV